MIFFIILYIFSVIGYLGSGLFIYVNFDTNEFNKIRYYFEKLLIKLFYKNNKNDCELEDGIIWYKKCEWKNGNPYCQSKIYYESDNWNSNYQPFLSIFELLSLIFWPIWILINLIIGAFYDD